MDLLFLRIIPSFLYNSNCNFRHLIAKNTFNFHLQRILSTDIIFEMNQTVSLVQQPGMVLVFVVITKVIFEVLKAVSFKDELEQKLLIVFFFKENAH